MPRTRLVALLAFLPIVAILALLPGPQRLDWRLFAALFRGPPPPWAEEIVVVDLPRTDAQGAFSLVDYRRRIADLMQQLAAGAQGRPRAVVFDIAFGRETEEAQRLDEGMRALAGHGVARFVAVDPRERPGPAGSLVAAAVQQVDGVGHTEFGVRAGVLLYPVARPTAAGSTVSALPLRVAADLYGTTTDPGSPSLAVRLGAREALAQRLWRYQVGAGSARLLPPAGLNGPGTTPSLDGRIVIVGSLADDDERFDGRSGPELLAWALAARIARVDALPGPRPLGAPWLTLALLAIVPALAAGVFATLRRRLASTHRNALAALAGLAVAAIALAVVVGGLLALGHLYAQVTLVMLASIAAIALAWLAAFQSELLASLQADLESGKLSAPEHYDVFISYSHEPRNAKWVEENLFRPLSQARHPDGRPFKVFFDTRNLRLGDFWYRRLALAIAGSRHFVPVYSDDYFTRAFCIHEMTLALARSAQKSDFILPLLRTTRPIPAGYEHIQYIDATAGDFVGQIVERCKMHG